MSLGEIEEDLQSTWDALLQRRAQLHSDRKLAELALALIAELGNGPEHREILRQLMDAWSADSELTLGIAGLLIEQAGRRGMDEPTLADDGPAWWAAAGLQRCLDGLGEPALEDADIAGSLYAMRGNALRLCGSGRDAEAQEAFTRAIELDAERGEWWYDAGLLDKWRGRFEDGFAANEQARMRLGAERPVLWNLAICATALGKAEEAVQAWEALGVPARLDQSRQMPYVAGLPPLLLRVLSRTPDTDATSQLPSKAVAFELVWVAPLSPCHGVVQSPTFRDAPIDYGDLVLWDGAPVAAHEVFGQGTVPVFPLLEILRRGEERRWPFVALEREAGALDGLEKDLPEGTRIFVQHERIAHHCAACEAGEPHGHGTESRSMGEPAAAPAAPSETAPEPATPSLLRGKIVVQPTQDLGELRRVWEAATGARALSIALPALYEELADAKRAGQEHQAWRGIEGKALRQKARA
jgi:hypothetical protein